MSRNIIVTGASGSMGAEAVRALALAGNHVLMACRNIDKADAVRKSILSEIPEASIDLEKLDLSSIDSVKSFCSSIEGMKIDALFNNAGIINREYRLTSDGFENTLATNYLGPYCLTRMLLPLMPDGARIVNMVSLTCRFGKVDRDFFNKGKESFRQLGTYSDTKLALLLFSIALSRKERRIHVNVSDPGIVNSNMLSMGRWFDRLADIFFRPLCSSPEKGVSPALKALSSDCDLNYFVGKTHFPVKERYLSHPMADWLWNETEKLLHL